MDMDNVFKVTQHERQTEIVKQTSFLKPKGPETNT